MGSSEVTSFDMVIKSMSANAWQHGGGVLAAG